VLWTGKSCGPRAKQATGWAMEPHSVQFLEAHVSERATQEAGPFVGALPPHMRASALLPPAPAVNRRMAARGRQISKLTARVVLKPTDEPTQGGSKDSAGALDGLFAAPPSWQALSSLHVTALAAGLGATDTPAWALTRARCDAASQLSGETAMEVLDESPDVLDICSTCASCRTACSRVATQTASATATQRWGACLR
jgi:hypothetical protein